MISQIFLSFSLVWLVVVAGLFGIVAWGEKEEIAVAVLAAICSILSVLAAVPVWHLIHV